MPPTEIPPADFPPAGPEPADQGGRRSLPMLRAMIDTLDHELLSLLARRNELIAEVAEHKRTHGVPIRDFNRERDLLADRRRYGEQIGMSPEIVESIFRLVLWASRDRQAALKAEVPPSVTPRTVAIVGGAGGMGQCLGRMFADLGHTVLSADLNSELTPADAARQADVVMISVPIEATEQVIRELGPLVREDGLLCDVTSIKAEPMRAMLEASRCSVVGMHPLFGPGVHSLQGQRVVLTRGRGDDWFAWVEQMLHARGLVTVETTPDEHDRLMAIVQVLVHFNTEVMGMTMAELNVPMEDTLRLTSPIYLIKMLLTARHFGQSADLYAGIEMGNPMSREVMERYTDVARRLGDVIQHGDRTAFANWFAHVDRYFGDFTTEALEQSSFLIDRIVERA